VSVWTLLDGGFSMPARKTPGQRVCLWVGYRLATRHRNVVADRTCLISPEARICPRQGRIEIGAETQIALGVLLQGNVRIGHHSSVQAYGNLVGYGGPEETQGRLTIGDNVRIASHAVMIAGDHRFDRIDALIREQGHRLAPITIEDDVWIGSHVVIVAGVTIGHGSVIGAGSVVTRDVPPYSVAVGAPAKVIKDRRMGATSESGNPVR
jgi:acetyltransferase-like isoleucine patch superfamily enzyme